MKYELITYLIRNRRFGWACILVSFIFAGLSRIGIPFYQCPFKQITTLPCPGCGLTRSARELLKGNWQKSLEFHWFTSAYFLIFLVVLICLLSQKAKRPLFIKQVSQWERKTRWALWFFAFLMIYTLTRWFTSL